MTVFDSGPCDWLGLPLLLPTPTTQFSLNHKRRSRKRNRKKWKRSDSSDSDSVELMTPLTTPLFDYDYDSDYGSDSDSVASENQPLRDVGNQKLVFTVESLYHKNSTASLLINKIIPCTCLAGFLFGWVTIVMASFFFLPFSRRYQ